MKKKMATFLTLALCGGFLATAATPSPKRTDAPRVPEPRPVRGPIEVHAFYYPGTEQMAEWDQVDQTLPGIKPLLGWYDEGNPEVVDWQIKWATEHGISAFCVDWYWNRGDQRLNHWVDAYYKARHRRHLKWYMMYANHNEPGAHSTEDQIRVTRYWIDHFFKTPEYYTIDGKPVVVYWSFDSLDADFRAEMERKGIKPKYGDGAKYALKLTDRMVREAGLPGVYFIDMYHGWSYMQDRVDRARNAGYQAQMIYNFDTISSRIAPEAVHPGDTANIFSYDAVVAAVPKWWEMTSRDPSFPFWPMIPTGWNDIPRSFEQSRVIYGRSVDKFRKICADCRAFCEKKGFKRVIIAPLNEWQEGSYIEPNEEFGFGMYDAIRDVFCEKPAEGWPKNILPKDVGCGLYDYPALPHLARTAWDFDDGSVQGWYRNPYGTAYLRNHDGKLWFFRSFKRNSPAIRTRLAPFAAKDFHGFRVKMRLQPGKSMKSQPTGKEQLTLWWGTDKTPVFSTDGVKPGPGGVTLPTITRTNRASTPVKVDGEWHEYTLDLSGHPGWTGQVDEVWFDPVELVYSDVLIDSMSFIPANEPEVLAQEFIAPPVEGHVHASTLLPLKDGGYLAAWFEGTKEGAPDVAIKGSRRRDGRWEPVRVLAKVNDDAPHWNPVLWRADDGRIVLFFKVGRNHSDWRTYVRESRDEGESWTPPRELIVGEVRGGRGPVRNKCLRLANGRWLAPASREIGRWRAFVDISDDDGQSWRASPEFPVPTDAPAKFGVIQPTLWADASGVHALMRANDGWIWQTDSTDGGETWGELRRSPLENINSGIDCVRASDGRLYLVLNGADPSGKKGSWGSRCHLELRSSSDGGETWQTCRVLANDAPRQPDGRGTEFSYPAIREPRPGVLAITFTWNRRQIRFIELRCPQASR